jgi:hypothetical protein
VRTITEEMSGFEIMSDGKVVWVHSARGSCVGRFSRRGIDVHHETAFQITTGQQCLDCRAGPCGEADWEYFRIGMRMHYGLDISDLHMPTNLMVTA